MAIKIDARGEADSPVLFVHGEVDMDSSPDLKNTITRSLKGAQILRVDLSDVPYIDSSGIAVLIKGLKDAQKSDVEFRLVSPSPTVREVIELSMLQQVFTIEDPEGD